MCPPRGLQVSHHRWISENMLHACLNQLAISLSTLALKQRGDVTRSPKPLGIWVAPQKALVVQKRSISGSTKRTYVLQKILKNPTNLRELSLFPVRLVLRVSHHVCNEISTTHWLPWQQQQHLNLHEQLNLGKEAQSITLVYEYLLQVGHG